MEVYPLEQIGIEEAKQKQFALVDEICNEFSGAEILNLGDIGVVQPENKPLYTLKVERVLAKYFHAEKAILVTGAGTGAIRNGLMAMIGSNANILIHNAPIYPTTLNTLNGIHANLIKADFNHLEDIKSVMNANSIDGAIIQYTRQKPDDSYDIEQVIHTIKKSKNIPILTDDNYAVMKVNKIGCELGADISAFSAFKLLGPEGVGVVLGKSNIINKIEELNYSGGSKVQGWQAMEMLRMLVYTPVSLAIQAEENQKIISKIKEENLPEIKECFIANAQSKVVLVEFNENIAIKVLKEAEKLGAAPNPVGAESKYEIVPMFYKASRTYLDYNPNYKETMIRINPMRAGSETVIRILKESIKKVKECS
ncbi:MAG: aminotransferase class V-fold PLP-dependent enzyme [Bacilli bacterium]